MTSTAEKVATAKAMIQAVGKDHQTAATGKYMFRGIEDVTNAISPVLASLELNVRVITHEYRLEFREVTTSNGNVTERRTATVHAEYQLVGGDGEHVSMGDWWGEADAYDDKATNKAYSAARKLALCEFFTIPTADMVDTESHVDQNAGAEYTRADPVDLTANPDAATAEQVKEIKMAVGQLVDADRDKWTKTRLAKDYTRAFAEGRVTYRQANDVLAQLYSKLGMEPFSSDPPSEGEGVAGGGEMAGAVEDPLPVTNPEDPS